jgi:hypothetical protein
MTERSVFWANHLKAIDLEGISARAYAAREGLNRPGFCRHFHALKCKAMWR